MPNWCYNNVRVNFDGYNEQKLRDVLDEEKDLFNQLLTRPKEYDEGERWYGWNVAHWGTKWDTKPRNISWGEGSVTFTIETAWSPPIEFYRYIEDAYGYEVEAYYLEEGMAFTGRYSGGDNDFIEYNDMTADEMEKSLPEWVEDEWNLVSMQREREDEEKQEEYNAWVAQLERTEWFDGKVKPERDGRYEVTTKAWAFPHFREFKDGKWVDDYNKTKVVQWRGITEEEYLGIAIDSLNEALKELDE